MDVPVIAYRNAGASLRRLMEADYRRQPANYDPRDGKPGNPFFHRRARNLYAFCRAKGRIREAGPPRPGDVAFYSRRRSERITHIAIVSQVEPDGRYRVVEASRDYFYLTREVAGDDVGRRGWRFRGFGDILGRPQRNEGEIRKRRG